MSRTTSIALGLITGFVISAGWAGPAIAADAPDAWITTKVKMALLVAEDVSPTAVRVDTTDGKVTLYGTVSSADEKARAERAAKGVKGVHEVRGLLQVVEKPRQETVAVADEALSAEVRKRLDADPGAARQQDRGEVGEPGRRAAGRGRADAERAPARTRGGARSARREARRQRDREPGHAGRRRDLARRKERSQDGHSVGGEGRLDHHGSEGPAIANSDTPARDINVDTLGGVVTLFGTVPTEAARRAAEMEVKKVDGVKSVENELQVVPQVSAAAVEHQDEKVKDAVEKRL